MFLHFLKSINGEVLDGQRLREREGLGAKCASLEYVLTRLHGSCVVLGSNVP